MPLSVVQTQGQGKEGKLHILIIAAERFLTTDRPLGGIFEHDQAHALKRAGFQIGVIAPKPRPLRLLKERLSGWPQGIEILEDNGIRVFRYQGWGWAPGRTPRLSSQFYLMVGKRLFKQYIAEQGMPDIIHAHNVLYAGTLALSIKMAYHVPFVVTEHSSVYLSEDIQEWQLPIIRSVLENADARIVVSQHLGKALEKWVGTAACPWTLIPNILGSQFEDQVVQEEQGAEGNDCFRFLNIASMVAVKNHKSLLEAFSNKFRGAGSFQLRIGGNGPLCEELKELAKNLGIADQVIFLGAIARKQVLAEMQACNVFVLPSYHETFGVALIEALACGKPVIATACGGPEEIIHNGNGILVPPGDTETLANVMDEIVRRMDCYNSVAIRKDSVSRFGEKKVVTQLTNVYQQVIDRNKWDKLSDD